MISIEKEFEQIADNFLKLRELTPDILLTIKLCTEAVSAGNKIMFCGNGGSASQSQHLAAELVGRYKKNRPAMNSIALTVDTSVLTAVGNDYGFDTIFERQIEGLGKKGDLLFGLSTSGNSRNIVLAFEKAKQLGIHTVAMTGSKDCKMKELADITLAVPSEISNNIQEMHLAIGHLICGEVESFFYE